VSVSGLPKPKGRRRAFRVLMLVIRFTRRGRRNDPSFKLVVTEQSNPVKGRFLEELGFYSPKMKTKNFAKERILYWVSKGAKLSKTVNNLLVGEGIIQGKKVKAWRPKKRSETEAPKKEKTAEAKKAEVVETKKSEAEPIAKDVEKKEEKVEEQPENQETPDLIKETAPEEPKEAAEKE